MDDSLQLTREKQTGIPTRGHSHGGTKLSCAPSYTPRRRQIGTQQVGMDKIKRKRRRSGEDLLSLLSM